MNKNSSAVNLLNAKIMRMLYILILLIVCDVLKADENENNKSIESGANLLVE
jgi:hypothetical protein